MLVTIFLVFLILQTVVFLSAYLAQGKLFGLWDELRLWGAYPKALYTY